MKLALLYKREPFSDNFINTLGNYLKNVHCWEGEITWKKVAIDNKNNKWFVNLKLNLIYCSEDSREMLSDLTKEYEYNPIYLMRILQKLYTRLALYRFLRYIFVDSVFTFSTKPDSLLNCSITGGNRILRIINYDLRKCVVLHKVGFPVTFFNNQIMIRIQFDFFKIPELYSYSLDQGWYEEKLIKGLPINRTGNREITDGVKNKAFVDLVKLYQQTNIVVSVETWLDGKVGDLMGSISLLPEVYDSYDHERLISLVNNFKGMLKNEMSSRDSIISTSITHGDFQEANILYEEGNENKYYIIDWEFSQRRIYFYDALVLHFRARQPEGLATRLKDWLNSPQSQYDSLCWCSFPSEFSSKFIIYAFLIEELLFRIQDSIIPELKKKHEGLLTFISEIEFFEK